MTDAIAVPRPRAFTWRSRRNARRSDERVVLERFVRDVVFITQAQCGYVATIAPNGAAVLACEVDRNGFGVDLEECRLRGRIAERVLEARESLLVRDARMDPRFESLAMSHWHGGWSLAAAPLLADGVLLGVIVIESRHRVGAFKWMDLDALETLAVRASVALGIVRALERTGRIGAAAELLGVHRATLRRKMRLYGIPKPARTTRR